MLPDLGAALSQHAVINNCYMQTVYALGAPWTKVICNPVPMFHVMGLVAGVAGPVVAGITNVLPFYFPDTLTNLKAIEKYKCATMRGYEY